MMAAGQQQVVDRQHHLPYGENWLCATVVVFWAATPATSIKPNTHTALMDAI